MGLVALAWAALWWLERSPWGVVFHLHAGHEMHSPAIDPAAPLGASLFVAGWVLMTVAMMLPATIPVAEVFRRLVSRRSNAPTLVALMLLGYLAVWTGLGVAVYALQLGLNGYLATLAPQGWATAAVLFLLAGGFQFSSLKYRCLDRCRTPLGFVLSRWHGRRESLAAFRLGAEHGAFCVGCCWALMLLMFAVGTAHLAWMLLLGVIMGLEKNAPWGRRLGHPLGFVLLSVAAILIIANLGTGHVAA